VAYTCGEVVEQVTVVPELVQVYQPPPLASCALIVEPLFGVELRVSVTESRFLRSLVFSEY
jgi:hypothetical protein